MKVSSNTEWLFFHLWKKNPYTLQPCEKVLIPDTIFYRWAQPYLWYFNSSDLEINRRTKEKIVPESIEEHFFREPPKNGVIATYITCSSDNTPSQQAEVLEFEYLEPKEFKELLNTQEKALSGILQKFIEPRQNRNSVIKVSWTPQFCLIYKKTNLNDISNKKIDIPQRFATFEGPEYICEAESLSSSLIAEEIQNTCLQIVKHIEIVSGDNISLTQLVLYFKVDPQGRLWLLFCTGVKFRERSDVYRAIPSKMPGHLKNLRPESPVLKLKDHQRKKKPQNQPPKKIYYIEGEMLTLDPNTCIQCGSSSLGEFYDMEMKKILAFWENYPDEAEKYRHKDQSLVIERDSEFNSEKSKREPMIRDERIPSVMYKLYPFLTYQQYLPLRRDKKVLEHVVKLCLDCYLAVTDTILLTKIEVTSLATQNLLKEHVRKKHDPLSLQNMIAQSLKQSPVKDGQSPELDLALVSTMKKSPTKPAHARKLSFVDDSRPQTQDTNAQTKSRFSKNTTVTGGRRRNKSLPKLSNILSKNVEHLRIDTPEAHQTQTLSNHPKSPSVGSQFFVTTVTSPADNQIFNIESRKHSKKPSLTSFTTHDWKENFKAYSEVTHYTEKTTKEVSLQSGVNQTGKTIFRDLPPILSPHGETRNSFFHANRPVMRKQSLSSLSTQSSNTKYKNDYKSISGTINDLKKFLKSDMAVDL